MGILCVCGGEDTSPAVRTLDSTLDEMETLDGLAGKACHLTQVLKGSLYTLLRRVCRGRSSEENTGVFVVEVVRSGQSPEQHGFRTVWVHLRANFSYEIQYRTAN